MHIETFTFDPDEVYEAYKKLVALEARKVVKANDPYERLLRPVTVAEEFFSEVLEFFNSVFGVDWALKDWNETLKRHFRFEKGFALFTLPVYLPYDILKYALQELCGEVEVSISEALKLHDFTESYLRLLIEVASPFCDTDEVEACMQRLRELRRLVNRVLKKGGARKRFYRVFVDHVYKGSVLSVSREKVEEWARGSYKGVVVVRDEEYPMPAGRAFSFIKEV